MSTQFTGFLEVLPPLNAGTFVCGLPNG